MATVVDLLERFDRFESSLVAARDRRAQLADSARTERLKSELVGQRDVLTLALNLLHMHTDGSFGEAPESDDD
jgi:hypothetical protein